MVFHTPWLDPLAGFPSTLPLILFLNLWVVPLLLNLFLNLWGSLPTLVLILFLMLRVESPPLLLMFS